MRRALEASNTEADTLRSSNDALRSELTHAATTMRDAAAQGARIAAEEHARMLMQFRLQSLLILADYCARAPYFGRWVAAVAMLAADEVRVCRTRLLHRVLVIHGTVPASSAAPKVDDCHSCSQLLSANARLK